MEFCYKPAAVQYLLSFLQWEMEVEAFSVWALVPAAAQWGAQGAPWAHPDVPQPSENREAD